MVRASNESSPVTPQLPRALNPSEGRRSVSYFLIIALFVLREHHRPSAAEWYPPPKSFPVMLGVLAQLPPSADQNWRNSPRSTNHVHRLLKPNAPGSSSAKSATLDHSNHRRNTTSKKLSSAQTIPSHRLNGNVVSIEKGLMLID